MFEFNRYIKRLNHARFINIVQQVVRNKYFFPALAFLLPFVFYFGVFLGSSFGVECAAAVMGFKAPYGQTITNLNPFCTQFADPGAYVWQHVPQWIKLGSEYMSFHFPLWNQNSGIGVPFAANFISTAFFLPLLPFTLFKAIFALDLFIVFRMAIASLGMYLFLRAFKLPKTLCLIGSVLIFLNGYMTSYSTISHQSVDVLLPWIGFLITKSFQEKKLKYFVYLALATSLSHLGASPESSVFVALFFIFYSTFIALLIEPKRKFKLLFWYSLSFLLSISLTALLILPGYEFIVHSRNVHTPDMSQLYSASFINTIFFVYPLALGLLHNPIYNQVTSWLTPNYIGSFFSFFLIFPFFLILDIKSKLRSFENWQYYLFFIFFLIFLFIQYFGILEIPLFTKLPGFSQTNFPKYSLSLINLLIALIVPFSIYYQHQLSKTANTFRQKLRAFFPLFLTFCFFLVATFITYRLLDSVAISTLSLHKFKLHLYFSIAIFSFAFIFCLIKNVKIKYILLLLLASGELFIFVPFNRGDSQRRDSLRKPPAISLLQNKDYRESRIFSPDYILYPDFSAAYDLNDVRDLNALWPANYYNYLKEFIVPEMDKTVNRFTGIRDSNSADARFVNNTYFDLLSVKYILSYNDVNAYEDRQRLIPYFSQFTETPSLRSDVFNINGISKPVLFAHASEKLQLTINKPPESNYFYLFPALSEKVFNENKSGSDGVNFNAKVIFQGQTQFEKSLTIDPKANKSDQKWFEFDLGPFPKEEDQFTLVLETNSLKTNINDWSGWGGFVWDTEINLPKNYQYQKIYDKEMKIFENKNFVPRLNPIDKVICVSKESEIFPTMRKLESVIKSTAVVLDQNCKNEELKTNIKISNQTFEDQLVSFTYSSEKPAYVILSNLYYPGWKLKVHGKEIPIERANYTFQGLRLPAGKNVRVEVIYDADSFKLGFGLTSISLLLSVFVLWKFGNRKIDTIKTARVK